MNAIAPCPKCQVRQIGPRVRVRRGGQVMIVCRACAQRMAVGWNKLVKKGSG